MQPQSNRKILVLAGGVFVLILVFGVVATIMSNKKKPDSVVGTTTTTIDPTSHETTVAQAGQAPETNGTQTSGPRFLGLSSLVSYGVSLDQITSLQLALGNYKPFATGVKQISLAVDDIAQISASSSGDPQGRWSIKSHIVVDNKATYKITVYLDGLSGVQLHIYDKSGSAQLYDSGVVDVSDGSGD